MTMYKHKPGPVGGETSTMTCFTCGMPSSKEWAQKVYSRPNLADPSQPFYPFLLEIQGPPAGSIFMEDGSTYLCAFCQALLESQWDTYEGKTEPVPPKKRKYTVHKFICAVCGVETYRRRVRALPFQEFPFLAKGRPAGSITLGNNPLAVVCLDCSETLWAQSAEYDRWGLPVHKRHFNWMARPPPPEDSVEATVARLPSGETQLPRCPPTDPLVPAKSSLARPETIPPIKSERSRTTSMGSPSSSQIVNPGHGAKHPSHPQMLLPRLDASMPAIPRSLQALIASRKPLMNCLDGSLQNQPPVVTVAPISPHNVPVGAYRKNLPVYPPSPSHEGTYSHEVGDRAYARNCVKHVESDYSVRAIPLHYRGLRGHTTWPPKASDRDRDRAEYDEDSSDYPYHMEEIISSCGHYFLPWRMSDGVPCHTMSAHESTGHASVHPEAMVDPHHIRRRPAVVVTSQSSLSSTSMQSSRNSPRPHLIVETRVRRSTSPVSEPTHGSSIPWENIQREDYNDNRKQSPERVGVGAGFSRNLLNTCRANDNKSSCQESTVQKPTSSKTCLKKKDYLLPKKRHWEPSPSDSDSNDGYVANVLPPKKANETITNDLSISSSSEYGKTGAIDLTIATHSPEIPDTSSQKDRVISELEEKQPVGSKHRDSGSPLSRKLQQGDSACQSRTSSNPFTEDRNVAVVTSSRRSPSPEKSDPKIENTTHEETEGQRSEKEKDGSESKTPVCINYPTYIPRIPKPECNSDTETKDDISGDKERDSSFSFIDAEKELQRLDDAWKGSFFLLKESLKDAQSLKTSTPRDLKDHLEQLQNIRKILKSQKSNVEEVDSLCKELEQQTSLLLQG